MFIGGLNWETTDDSLKEYFSQFGEVTECTVMRDGPTGRSRGFGFLTFKDPKTVNIVMVKEHYLDGKIIDPKRAIPRDEQEKTSKIFVGGVSQEATESDFREYFLQFGRVLDATLMMDKDTGRPRGFGFVTFDSESAVENALNCPTLAIMGKQIEVKKAQPRGNTRGGHMDERDDRGGGGGFRDRGNRDRFDNRDGGSNGNYMNGSQGSNGPQGGPQQQQQSAAYNGMTPQMMAQYWQQMQRYMAAMSQMGRGGPMPVVNPAMMQQAMQNMPQQMAGMNPAMMQQMQMQQAAMMRQQHQQSPPIQSPPQQMPLQMAQQQQPYGNQNQGYPQQQQQQHQHQQQQGGQGGGGYDPSQQQQQAGFNNPNARFQNHPSQRDYQPPQNHPSSWDGMYDDIPPQQVVQQVHQQQAAQAAAAAQQSSRGGTPNSQQFGRFEGPPPNAPTGPRNTKPGSNYRGGRGGSSGGSSAGGGSGSAVGSGGAGRGAGYNSGVRGGFHPYARNQERFT
ncbi:hypothetical protein BZA05DRAFT_59474 [Tricharina praecox]|uniref:uncharacterized protein n=1 Tax=Tricharina praecox TaxID=43433 RepID=UPI0022202359|nr:uncharacterized protein BZA05DRAFT_59474 [Tricharina praecox]KAI5850643.1 hypothetical protein BZA05DRAFT_59474 [Tricharina praecox]